MGRAEWLVVRRVRALAITADQLAAGDVGARARLPRSGDELGQLAQQFDRMAESIAGLSRHNRLVLESTAEGILSLDRGGVIVSANPSRRFS